jgi:hypothetical protein
MFMAARISRRHSDLVREKIRASVIIDRLQKHVLGELEMTPTQVAAANSLLDRSVPKLSQIQHVGDEAGGPVKHLVEVAFVANQNKD